MPLNLKEQPIPVLVAVPREQYLVREEVRIRSAGHIAAKTDPVADRHLNAVLMCEDLYDIHDVAAEKQRRSGSPHFAKTHERLRDAAKQLKLHHLDQLAHIL